MKERVARRTLHHIHSATHEMKYMDDIPLHCTACIRDPFESDDGRTRGEHSAQWQSALQPWLACLVARG
jgi:hypothetical protein